MWYEIKKVCGEVHEYSNDHQFYEYSEMIDRQSKYVVTGQKFLNTINMSGDYLYGMTNICFLGEGAFRI